MQPNSNNSISVTPPSESRFPKPMGRLKFLLEGLKDIQTVGTIARTSTFAAKQMIRQVDFAHTNCIVEFGAGDGVITKCILEKMKPDALLLSFEVNPSFCEILNQINDPRLVVINDSAEKVADYLRQNGHQQADHIISAIPFAAIPPEVGQVIVDQARNVLRKGGLYVQIHYSLVRRKLYEKVFGNVDWEITPINIPPAFILTSVKE
jgi:phospholipid N-methyltransferase